MTDTEIDLTKAVLICMCLSLYSTVIGTVLYYMIIEPLFLPVEIFAIISATFIVVVMIMSILAANIDWD